MKTYLLKFFVLITFLVGMVDQPLNAADKTRIGLTGAWQSPPTWTPSGQPLATDRAIFNNANPFNVTFSANPIISQLQISTTTSSNVTFNLANIPNPAQNRVLTITNDLTMGFLTSGGGGGSGQMTINNGTLNANGGIFTNNSSVINVNTAGRLNSGVLNSSSVTNTATTLNVSGNGIATLTGINTGSFASLGGTNINVTNGGTLNTGTANFNSGIFVADTSIPVSDIKVDGNGSVWNSSGDINLSGGTSQGVNLARLTVSNQGQVISNGTINTTSNGRVVISSNGLLEGKNFNLANGTLDHSGGTLRVNGGVFTNNQASNQFNVGGTDNPVVEFTNGASEVNIDQVNVGNANGAGTLKILNGSTLTTTNGFLGEVSASPNGHSGDVVVGGTNASWTNTGNIFVGTTNNAGSLTINSGGTVTTNLLNSSALGSVNVNGGTLNVNNWTYASNIVQTGGIINAGQLSTINNNLTISTTGQFKLGNSLNTTLRSSISGSGTFVKQGTGNLGLASNVSISTDNISIDQGTLSVNGTANLGVNSNVILNGGVLNLTGPSRTIGSLSGNGNGSQVVMNVNSGELKFGNNNTSTSFGGVAGGPGTLTKIGTGTFDLNGRFLVQTFNVDQGVVNFGRDSATSTTTNFNINSQGTANINGFTQTVQSLQNNGTLNLNGGTVNVNGQFTTNGGTTNIGTGTLQANTINSTGGTFNVGPGGTIQTNYFNLDAGSHLNLNATSNLIVTGNFINNGMISGPVNLSIEAESVLSGSGQFESGTVSILNGGGIAPGNSIGTMFLNNLNFGPDGYYQWEIGDATGVAGTGWDFLSLTGQLDITATAGNPFEIDITSFGGPAMNFDPLLNYQWVLLQAAGGINGYNSSLFTLNTANFSNLYGGTFSLQQNGNSLNLIYTAATANVPEPGALCLSCLGLLGLYGYRRRRLSLSKQH